MLYHGNHIDETTEKWLSLTQNLPRIPVFYTLTKIHKPNPVGRPFISGCESPGNEAVRAQQNESHHLLITSFILLLTFRSHTLNNEWKITLLVDCLFSEAYLFFTLIFSKFNYNYCSCYWRSVNFRLMFTSLHVQLFSLISLRAGGGRGEGEWRCITKSKLVAQ